jgi:hypothetical protein
VLLQTGLTATEALWPPLRQAYAWLHQAAHILANEEQYAVTALKETYERLLFTMTAEREKLGELAHAVTHFCKVTASYWEGLFACYQLNDFPRTNNELEHYFGSTRHVERRATGRKGASPALVVRGAVRVVAAGASRFLSISPCQLQVTDVAAWRALRQQVAYRHECRRRRLRFRRDPDAYLTALEQRLCTPSLPS